MTSPLLVTASVVGSERMPGGLFVSIPLERAPNRRQDEGISVESFLLTNASEGKGIYSFKIK